MRCFFSQVLLLVVIFAAGLPLVSLAQNSMPMNGAQTAQPDPQGRIPDQITTEMEQRRQRELNKQRYEQMKRDADKLLQVATDLKTYVDQSNENVMSVTVIKKAEEMERLAKSVKEKMRGN